ncbi:MAG: AraC family transcriptional regulator [Colwellia sp.]|nr:AraC family transcriptional regulator [Colwellia sp.]
MPIILQHLFAIGGFHGILLFCLLTIGSDNTKANKILGVWCLFLGLFFLGILVNVQTSLNIFSFFIGWNVYLPASFGALLYLYCRQAITDRSFSSADILHVLPVLACYLLNIDDLFTAAEIKLSWATAPADNNSSLQLSQWIIYSQAFIYLGFSFQMVRKYQRAAKNNLADFNPEIFRWIWILLILTLSVWSFKLVSSSETLYFLSVISDLVIIFLIYGVALAQWRNPKLFKINKIEEISASIQDTQTNNAQTNSSAAGLLDSSTRESISTRVKQFMDEEHAYKDSQLNLLRLAQLIGVSTHHLSEALNQHQGKNFYQFINDYRVNYVREMLAQQQTAKILDLAMTAGFSSKSTFNAVFKQTTGLSPTQYRQKLTNTTD